MRKHIALIVVFAFLVGVVPVQAQGILRGGYMPDSPEGWYYYLIGDQVHMLQADNIEYVRRTMNIGRRASLRRVTDDLVGYNHQGQNFIGLQGSRGVYPMYECSSVGSRWRSGIGRTLMVAGVGYLAGRFIPQLGEREGALAGAGIGAGWALYKDAKCAPVQNQMVVIDDPSDLGSQPTPTPTSSGRDNDWNKRLRDQRYGDQPQAPAPVELEWQMLRNEFNGVTIYARVQGLDPNQPIVIPPNQTKTVQIPQGAQIWAEALVCLDENCTVRKWHQDVGRRPLPQGAGWVFYNPEEGR